MYATYLDVLVCLLGRERAAVPQEIDEAHSDTTINVEDELEYGQHGHSRIYESRYSPYPSST